MNDFILGLLKSAQALWSRRVLILCSAFSSILLILGFFPMFHDKLIAMNISLDYVALFWLFCMTCWFCEGWVCIWGEIKRKIDRHGQKRAQAEAQRERERAQAEAQREREKAQAEAQREREEKLSSIIYGLLPKEAALLRYVLSRPVSVTWLPSGNNAMIALCHKGCLKYARGNSELRGQEFIPTRCFACCVPLPVRDFILPRMEEIKAKWGRLQDCSEFDVFQE